MTEATGPNLNDIKRKDGSILKEENLTPEQARQRVEELPEEVVARIRKFNGDIRHEPSVLKLNNLRNTMVDDLSKTQREIAEIREALDEESPDALNKAADAINYRLNQIISDNWPEEEFAAQKNQAEAGAR